MIGTKTDAQIAWDAHHQVNPLPNDWDVLGSGVYRTAYRSPEGIVYKVGDEYENRMEVANVRRLREKAAKSLRFRMPKANLHRVKKKQTPQWNVEGTWVVAMEYVKSNAEILFSCNAEYGCPCNCKADVCITDQMDEIRRLFGLCDMHDENVLMGEDGLWWIIDVCQ